MKNRTFFATFLLSLLTIHLGILLISTGTLKDTTRQAKDQGLSEHYFMVSALYSDLLTLSNRGGDIQGDLKNMMQPFLYLAGNRSSVVALYQDGVLLYTNGSPSQLLATPDRVDGSRFVSIDREGGLYWCSSRGNLPQPYERYTVLYQMDVTKQINAWEIRNRRMFATAGGLSLLLAFFLLLLLNRLFRPLLQITQLSRKIAAGNYAVRLPESGRDEVSMVAKSLNHMAFEIEHKIAELAQAAADRQHFVDSFAHELRTPLTAIYGYAEYMQKAAISEDDAQFALDTILSESRRMQTMANQLMELSNLRSGSIQLKPQGLLELFESAGRSLAGRLVERGIQLEVSCRADLITGDAILLHILLVNLIDNAIKASSTGQTVLLAAEQTECGTVVSVRDCGKGMEASELAHITEPYYRVEKARNSKDGGAGIGLAICKQIAARHGAKLLFESAPGQGTVASVIFTGS